MKEFIKNLIKLSPIPLTKNHKYDLLTKKIFRKVLTEKSNCIDVGCHKGEIMDILLQMAPSGSHHGIEAIPAMAVALEKKYNPKPNVRIHNIAASYEKGVTEFNHVVSNPAYSGIKKRDYDREGEQDEKIQVQTDLLDSVIPSDLPIQLIKIDVEGAEMLVLNGATRIMKDHQPTVVFEFGLGASDHYGTKPEDIYNYFKKYNMEQIASLPSNFIISVQLSVPYAFRGDILLL